MADAIVPAGVPTPVMDVVAPPSEKEEKHEASSNGIDPVDALAVADKQSRQVAASLEEPDKKTAKRSAEHAPAPAKPPTGSAKPKDTAGNGVGLAIAATVIIVFGLAILAVYAYIQTNK